MNVPPLKFLHPESSLIRTKLEHFRKLSSAGLIASLQPGEKGSLKARADGTLLEGHHRLAVLRERGVDINKLPREIVPRQNDAS